MLELKYIHGFQLDRTTGALNRTMLELKYPPGSLMLIASSLLIAPCWN